MRNTPRERAGRCEEGEAIQSWAEKRWMPLDLSYPCSMLPRFVLATSICGTCHPSISSSDAECLERTSRRSVCNYGRCFIDINLVVCATDFMSLGTNACALYRLFAEHKSLGIIPGYWQRHQKLGSGSCLCSTQTALLPVIFPYSYIYIRYFSYSPGNPPCKPDATMRCAPQTVQKEDFLFWRNAISSNTTQETEWCPLERNLPENIIATSKPHS